MNELWMKYRQEVTGTDFIKLRAQLILMMRRVKMQMLMNHTRMQQFHILNVKTKIETIMNTIR